MDEVGDGKNIDEGVENVVEWEKGKRGVKYEL